MIVTLHELRVELDRRAKNELDALVYWHSDLSYCKERWPEDQNELSRHDKTIKSIFNALDRLNIPFWLQNAALYYSEEWRNAYKCDFWEWLAKQHGYTVTR